MNKSMYESMYSQEQTHWWYRGKHEIVMRLIAGMRLSPGCKIADLGCGTGYLLSLLEKFGSAVGFDFNEQALRFSRERWAGPLCQLNLEKPIDPKWHAQFDLVVALDLVEHIGDDIAALKNIRRVLRGHNARGVITVPAFMFLWSAHDENCAHKRRYTRQSLMRACRAAGLHIEYVSYYNTLLFPGVLLVRVLSKLSKQKSGHTMETHKIPPWLNQVLYAIFASESHAVKRGAKLPFGVSLIAVVRR